MQPSVRVAAMNYLARREHSRAELDRKLALKGYAPSAIAEALDRLAAENLQSDQRFAENYCQHRFAAGFGLLKIRQELQQRGVAAEVIEAVVLAADIDWRLACETAWAKRFAVAPDSLQARAKQQRFLLQRGFAQADIQAVLAAV